ncbi:tRNA dihydrouridine synthase DusB [Porphyromonas macacae]|uniref:tRNA-dihydrouridine synthase n=1 Tax=Porphyromonas macacae TaxID=28115 RepID=A0A379DIX2_9PORP|nr:tRNA dihydrouridine synthase DusB [Porphyromonas macacae]SUB77695.1 Probable tRNA-dihydrouridine synthase [Porphyromonas macacae]
MRIRDIDLGKEPVLLAPMEDITDIAFRQLCKRLGADMVYSEFLSADALIRNITGTTRKLIINDEERPVAIQIYGRDTDTMVEAAKIVEEAHPDVLDINFGCPVKRVAGKGAGSGMLRNIPLMLEITKQVVKAVKLPVTVKTRLGWDANSIIIEDLAEQLQDCGIEALTIHGRTRAQMYTGRADWEPIGRVKSNPRIHIPIIGNGDIATPQQARHAFNVYGVDAIMVGRASIGRPWVFQEIKHYLEHGELPASRDVAFYMDILRCLVDNNIDKLDERRGVLHSRRHIAASPLFKGIPDFKSLKVSMLRAPTRAELMEYMEQAQTILEEIEKNKKIE